MGKNAYIIDPTIRYENNDPEQDDKICNEKLMIYEKCISYYKDKYTLEFGQREWLVRGLWFGSRGTVGKSVIKFFNDFKLEQSHLKLMTEDIPKATISIINNHIYK